MSRLEDWQLDLLQKEAEHEAGVGDYPFECFDERLPAVPAYWLRCLLEEIRASRASTGGGAEPQKELVDKLMELSAVNENIGVQAPPVALKARYFAISDAYKNAAKIVEDYYTK